MSELNEAIAYISALKEKNPKISKAGLEAAFLGQFQPTKMRSVFVGDGFAMRFCEAQTGGFANTVLSLSALQKHDTLPFVIVVNRARSVHFMLANATLLKKISHSSHQLRADNIKGSFNGSDIFSSFEGMDNKPDHFPNLFACHEAFSWQENVDRLVEETNGIIARDGIFHPSPEQVSILLQAGDRSATILRDPEYLSIERELQQVLQSRSGELLEAAAQENVNLRGNSIERIITGGENSHGLGDLERVVGGPLAIDIKTKLLDRASAPKAYNIDKALEFLAQPGSVFAFFLVVIDFRHRTLTGRLVPILEASLVGATRVQYHWAGRLSRGVTQLSGDLSALSAPGYRPTVDVQMARSFIKHLIDIKQANLLA